MENPTLRTMERGHQTDGWPLCARLSARPEISLESNSVQTLQNSSDESINRGSRVYTRAKSSHWHVKDSVVYVGVGWLKETRK